VESLADPAGAHALFGEKRDVSTSANQRALASRTLVVFGLALLVGGVVATALLTVRVLLLLFCAILVAVLLRSLSRPLSARLRLPPGAGFAIVTVGVAAITGISFWLAAPKLGEQLAEFAADLPLVSNRIAGYVERIPGARVFLSDSRRLQSVVLGWASVGASVSARSLLDLLFVAIIGIFLGASPSLYLRGALRLLPVRWRQEANETAMQMGRTLRLYLMGRLASMTGVGLCTWLVLSLLGIPLAGLLALIAGVLTFVPYVGSFVGGIPIGLIALTVGASQLAWALILYTLVQWLEGFVLAPLVQQRVVALAPALALAAQVILGVLFGFIGIIIAVPLAALVVVAVKRIYVEGFLEDHPGPPEGGDSLEESLTLQ
jgi:predicted PurR-regulated permease PerM